MRGGVDTNGSSTIEFQDHIRMGSNQIDFNQISGGDPFNNFQSSTITLDSGVVGGNLNSAAPLNNNNIAATTGGGQINDEQMVRGKTSSGNQLNNTSPLKQQLAAINSMSNRGEEYSMKKQAKMMMNSSDKFEKEIFHIASPVGKNLLSMVENKSKSRGGQGRFSTATDKNSYFRQSNNNHKSIKVKRDNFLGCNATKNSINVSPPKDNEKLKVGHSSNSMIPNKSAVRKPMNLIGIHTQNDSPPFPSATQLQKYKRAVLASPNQKQSGRFISANGNNTNGNGFQHGFGLTTAASAGKAHFRKSGGQKGANDLFKIIRSKNSNISNFFNASGNVSKSKTQGGLKFQSNLASDFLNLFHQD